MILTHQEQGRTDSGAPRGLGRRRRRASLVPHAARQKSVSGYIKGHHWCHTLQDRNQCLGISKGITGATRCKTEISVWVYQRASLVPHAARQKSVSGYIKGHHWCHTLQDRNQCLGISKGITGATRCKTEISVWVYQRASLVPHAARQKSVSGYIKGHYWCHTLQDRNQCLGISNGITGATRCKTEISVWVYQRALLVPHAARQKSVSGYIKGHYWCHTLQDRNQCLGISKGITGTTHCKTEISVWVYQMASLVLHAARQKSVSVSIYPHQRASLVPHAARQKSVSEYIKGHY